ncbi:MAG: hypothetical protein ACUVQG_07710 [Thermogutta sp.]
MLPISNLGSILDFFPCAGRNLRILAIILLICGACYGWNPVSLGQQVSPHMMLNARTPPGIAGATRLARGGPVEGYYQTVEIRGPHGVQISLVEGGAFGQPRNLPVIVGVLVGRVYRLKVMNLPGAEGAELFPTLEILDRLYPPPGQERYFPIIVELHPQDIMFALEGKFVTRVIYLEDPQRALPAVQAKQEQPWFEVRADQDPLIVADTLGRPMAILRMGGRLPLPEEDFDPRFLFGSPPLIIFPPQVRLLSGPPKVHVQAAVPQVSSEGELR